MPILIDLTGTTVNNLIVLSRGEDKVQPSGQRKTRWWCRCSCGEVVLIQSVLLNRNNIQYCKKCTMNDLHNKNRKHSNSGKNRTAEYVTFTNIVQRCYNPKSTSYLLYGGRGIAVCDRWRYSFENFLEDVGVKPTNSHSLERLDVDGDYSPENCIWATPEQQARNVRKRRNNTSGVTGVAYDTKSRAWCACWYWGGRQKKKSFSVEKYGEEDAFWLACEYRDGMIEKLNALGAGYTEKHGK